MLMKQRTNALTCPRLPLLSAYNPLLHLLYWVKHTKKKDKGVLTTYEISSDPLTNGLLATILFQMYSNGNLLVTIKLVLCKQINL
jgi:hypothetical protein